MHNMKEFLKTLPDEAIVVGGVSRWLNGYAEEPNKIWIDLVIPRSAVAKILSLGRRVTVKGETSFPYPIVDQILIRTDDYYLDVFVRDGEMPDYNIVSGSKVTTVEEDLDWHMHVSSSIPCETTHKKVEELKAIYNIAT